MRRFLLLLFVCSGLHPFCSMPVLAQNCQQELRVENEQFAKRNSSHLKQISVIKDWYDEEMEDIEEEKVEIEDETVEIKQKLGVQKARYIYELDSIRKVYKSVLRDLRAGYFCSRCGRSKTELDKGEGFKKHLGSVKGDAIPASADQIQRAEDQYVKLIQNKVSQITATERSLTSRLTLESELLDRLRKKKHSVQEQYDTKTITLQADFAPVAFAHFNTVRTLQDCLNKGREDTFHRENFLQNIANSAEEASDAKIRKEMAEWAKYRDTKLYDDWNKSISALHNSKVEENALREAHKILNDRLLWENSTGQIIAAVKAMSIAAMLPLTMVPGMPKIADKVKWREWSRNPLSEKDIVKILTSDDPPEEKANKFVLKTFANSPAGRPVLSIVNFIDDIQNLSDTQKDRSRFYQELKYHVQNLERSIQTRNAKGRDSESDIKELKRFIQEMDSYYHDKGKGLKAREDKRK